MINSKTAIRIIPARGGSKGLPGKSIRPMSGKPLINCSIEKALQWGHLDVVPVSTDSPDIAAIARDHGAAMPVLRPAELATDTVNSYDVICQPADRESDYTALLEPTSSLREVDDLDRVLAALADVEGSLIPSWLSAEWASSHPS